MENSCKICNGESGFLFKATVLHRYPVDYFKCMNCGFIQTESPFWLQESYSSAIALMDVGLVSRNILLANKAEIIINYFFNGAGQFLDYGGGYGLFVRLMRDKGFDFYRQDIFCENIFAKEFDLQDLNKDARFELLTAFEVFEHLDDPMPEIGKMFSMADNILFSTELQPEHIVSPSDWWYFVPETGQHIALYTLGSLQHIAKKFNKHLYSNTANLHLFTSRPINNMLFKLTNISWMSPVFSQMNSRESLLQKDFLYIKHKKDENSI